MSTRGMRGPHAFRVLLAVTAIGISSSCWAVVINFENPPYTPGPVLGQDGWVKPGYVGPGFDVNGTANISTTGPLSGAQSVVYNQTTAASGTGASDVVKSEVISVPGGVSGTDLTVSYLLTASGNGINPTGVAGLYLSNNAVGGSTPLFARLNGASMEASDTNSIVAIPNFVYFSGDVLQVKYEVDFDAANYVLTVNNMTTNQVEFQKTLGYLAPFTPEGPNGEYLMDVGLLLRGGSASFDDITLTTGVGPVIARLEWTANKSGNWGLPANWNPTGVPGNAPGRQTAVFGSAITAPQTIYTNGDRSLNRLEFNNANSYTITGTGSISMQADTSGASPVNPTIAVTLGSHQLQLKVNILDNTSVNVASGASLTFNNVIDLHGKTLTTSGTVNINNSLIGGGTLAGSGTLAALTSVDIDGNLVSDGKLLVALTSGGAASFNVSGDATLSGIVDVLLSPGVNPGQSFTIVHADGQLDTHALALDASDLAAFRLSTRGGSLMLDYIGTSVPEPAGFALLFVALAGLVLARKRPVQLSAAALLAIMAAPSISIAATGTTFDFENPPFTAGNLVGQNGFTNPAYVLADPFFGGALNGTVVVSNSAPLNGAQSALYTQISVPAGAGGSGASDTGKPAAVVGVTHGTDGYDITASFLINMNSNAVGTGQAGAFLGQGGRSPALILLTGTQILVGTGGALPSMGTYVLGHTFEFSLGIDLDNSSYGVSYRDVTAGGSLTPILGSLPNGQLPFFGGTISSDGDGKTYTLDATMMLRSGTAKIDDFTVVGSSVPEPAGLALLFVALTSLTLVRKRPVQLLSAAVVAILAAASLPSSASATTFDFENPPFTTGNLVGQNGFITPAYVLADPFFGGAVNGTVVVSNSAPLSGAQSALYTQTSVPAGAGGSGASDTGKPAAVFGTTHGTDAADITTSFLINMNANGVGSGQAGAFLGQGGRSPALILLSGTQILVGTGGALPNMGTYVLGHTFEFSLGIDLDNNSYAVSYRDVTAGAALTPIPGTLPNGQFPFFGGGITSDGDGKTFTLDATMMLRSGTAQIDNFTVVGDDYTRGTWAGNVSGDWNTTSSWIPRIIPGIETPGKQIAVFGPNITSPQSIYSNSTVSVNGLEFNTTSGVAIGGSGTVELKANTSGGVINPTVNVLAGNHDLQAPVRIADNTAVSVAATSRIDFDNSVNLNGKTLSISGAGVANLNVGVTGGGSITNSGSLGTAGTTPIAANLTSTGKLLIDLGKANTDFFNITGSANLSGILDVTLEPGFAPVGSYTVLTASGGLSAAGLVLDPSDTSQFHIGVVGNSLVLSVGGTGGVNGDYNGNGVVDAADYVIWRKNVGTTNHLQNDSIGGTIGVAQYNLWRSRFGATSGSGSGASLAARVPEPTTLLIGLCAFALCPAVRAKRTACSN